MQSSRPAVTVCFGGGGAYAYGFNMGVFDGLRDEGIDVSRSPMIGTSAGSHAAASIANDHSFAELAPVWVELGRAIERPFWLRASDLSERCFGDDPMAGDYAGVVVRMSTFRRHLMWASEVRPADIVAASSTVFPFARPHKIAGRRYLDGGFRSAASADLAPPADLLLLVTAFCDPRQGLLGRVGRRQARREITKWRKRHDGAVLHVTPTPAMTEYRMRNIRALGDMEMGTAIYDLARPLGREVATRLRREHPAVAARLVSTGG